MRTRLFIVALTVAGLVALLTSRVAARGGTNLGTVTAGAISGVTATFGSGGEVVLNSSGVTFAAGTGTANKIKFTGGETIHAVGGDLWIQAPTVQLVSTSTPTNVTGGMSVASGLEVVTGSLKLSALTGGTSFLCLNGASVVYATAGTCDGSVPAVAALRQEVADLKAEIAELRALLVSQR